VAPGTSQARTDGALPGFQYHPAMGSGAQRGEDRVALRSTLPVVLGLAIASLALRVLDLDYNGPFIDESFHAVVAAYGNVPHLTGDVLLYPQLSRLVHAHYGLVGARALSAVFGALTVACVFGIAAIVARRFVSDDAVVYVATGAAGLFAVSAPPLFVSQFANYYALSFLLFAFGCWATLRGLETGDRTALAIGAVAVVAACATRYLLLGFLPIALWVVAARTPGSGVRAPRAAFWIPFACAFLAYTTWNHTHIVEALRHAQQSGTGVGGAGSLPQRWLVLREALGRTAPVMLLAGIGLVTTALRTWRGGAEEDRAQRFDVLWLAVGSLWMTGYHVAFAHDLTMESNLTVSLIFAAVLAGLGLHRIAAAVTPRTHGRLAWALLAAAVAATALHARPIVAEDQTWPDWRPVVAAAASRGAGDAAAIWSTADNGGMRNSWGVRAATAEMSGNVWQLRAAFGPGVDVGSAWRHPRIDELLRLARRSGVEFVIGPLPIRNLAVGQRVRGFVVTDVVDVPFGPAAYILRRTDRSARD